MEDYQKGIINETIEDKLMNGVDEMDTVNVYLETPETKFWSEHGNTVTLASAGLATLAAGFTGGFFVGKKTEEKKRRLFMDEIIKNQKLMQAYDQGKTTEEIDGITYPTAGHKVDNVAELHEVITNNFLKDKKIKESEKLEWIAIAIDLANLGSQARTKQFNTSNEIVKDEEDNK